MVDQADNLRRAVEEGPRARILAVTSGKGGVGKTCVSVNLGIALVAQGARTILLDADLGLANVEVLLGLNSLYDLQHVIEGRKSMDDILIDGPGGLRVIPGSSGMAHVADIGPVGRQRVQDGLSDLQCRADVIIIDTMAGIGQNAVAFCASADEVLFVTTPEPSSIVNVYATIKTIHQMGSRAKFYLLINSVLSEEQARAVNAKLSRAIREYLGREVHYLGFVSRDPHVSRAVMQSRPFTLQFPNASATRNIEDIAARLLNQQVDGRGGIQGFFRRVAQNLGLAHTG